MKISHSDLPKKIGLFSAPWPIYSRPSIQLGTLKAWLKKQFPDIDVSTNPLYLKIAEQIGYTVYQTISEKSWMAESIYASILFEAQTKQIQMFFNKLLKQRKKNIEIEFGALTQKIKHISDEIIKNITWNEFDFIGFSVSICQLTSTLYFTREIKKRYPELLVIAGGSIISGHSHSDLKMLFPNVDLFVKGEGELPLEKIATMKKLFPINSGRWGQAEFQEIVDSPIENQHTVFQQIKAINNLPIPEFDDYFKLLDTFPSSKKFFPNIPLEISRGCWWHGKIGRAHV